MTGRDLILYILRNGLEDEPVFKDGKFIGFITAEEAAAMYGVGVGTIKVWYEFELIKGVKVGDTILIPGGTKPPIQVDSEPIAKNELEYFIRTLEYVNKNEGKDNDA